MKRRRFRISIARGAAPAVLCLALATNCASQNGGAKTGEPAGSGGVPSGGVTGSGGRATPATGSGGSGATTGTGGKAADGSGGAVGTGGGGPPASGGVLGSGGSAVATGGGSAGMPGGGQGAMGGGAPAGSSGSGGQVPTGLPDPGNDGDGDSTVGPTYTTDSDLSPHGNPKGKSFSVQVTSTIFNGKDPTLNKTPVNVTRTIQGYVPAMYKDGTPAPVLIIQDGPGELGQVSNALDNLTISPDPGRKLPPFIVIAVPSGGNDSIGSERGLEYDTLSDRYARYITQEVMPAVQSALEPMFPHLKFDPSASGRAALGCSSGGAAAFTMAWFRPDLFSRVIAYSATLVAQQDPAAPESTMYPHGAWDYHSDLELIKNDTTGREKMLRIFHNANEMDLGATAAESGRHNWLLAGMRTAAALEAKGFHYKFVEGLGVGHCAGEVQSATLADALVWVWRGYRPPPL